MNSVSKSKSLELLLQKLKTEKFSFEETAEMLFYYDYQDFNTLFHIDKIAVANKPYHRLPIYNGNFVAILMIWGIDNATAIHDHNNYDGRIKVLKGSLSELSYRENSNFIEYDFSQTAEEGQIFPEEYGGIHSIVNTSEDISVSLHIYRTEQLNLEGVRIFDPIDRKIAWLSKNATSCSWNLPEFSYQKIHRL
jgi:cysteine dioxygenase